MDLHLQSLPSLNPCTWGFPARKSLCLRRTGPFAHTRLWHWLQWPSLGTKGDCLFKLRSCQGTMEYHCSEWVWWENSISMSAQHPCSLCFPNREAPWQPTGLVLPLKRRKSRTFCWRLTDIQMTVCVCYLQSGVLGGIYQRKEATEIRTIYQLSRTASPWTFTMNSTQVEFILK